MKAFLSEIRERQHVYRAMNGRYWQGVISHSIIPKDGLPGVLALDNKATDEDNWTDFGLVLPPAIECALRVDTYSGVLGDGYTVTAIVGFNGDTYQRIANVGPERERATGWQKV